MNAQIKRVFMTLLLSVVCLFAMAQKTIHGTYNPQNEMFLKN